MQHAPAAVSVDAVVSPLLQYGVLGIVVLVFGAVIYTLWREGKKEREDAAIAHKAERNDLLAAWKAERDALILRISDLQAARVADSQHVQTQMVEVIKQCTEAVTNVSASLERTGEAMTEMRNSLRDVANELHRRPPG